MGGRSVTPEPSYEETQSELTCYMEPLEPFRDLENATFMEIMAFFIALDEDPEAFFVDCDPKAIEELEELFSID